MTSDLVPPAFAASLAGRPAEPAGPHGPGLSGEAWLAGLPRLLGDALAAWELTPDGPSLFGVCAVVVPVTRRDGAPAALKATWPHAEAAHEHLALRAWGGVGAVRLLAADPARHTLLLERLDPDRDLRGPDELDACAAIGTLLAALDRPAPPRIARLSDLTRAWLAGPLAGADPHGVPRRFVEQARALIADLSGPDLDARLVHTDLHYENALAPLPGSDRAEPWVAIDPKPLAADPAFAAWPALHNRWAEAGDDVPTVAWTMRTRLGALCEAAGIDEDRARGWAVVRTVIDALDLAAEGDRAALTDRITLLKALQPDA